MGLLIVCSAGATAQLSSTEIRLRTKLATLQEELTTMKRVAKMTVKQLKQTTEVANKNQELIDTLHIGEPSQPVLLDAQLQCY